MGWWWRVGLVLCAARALATPPPAGAALVAADVERIIGQAVAEAGVVGLEVAVAVVDHEGNPLGVFRTTPPGEPLTTTLRGFRRVADSEAVYALGEGLEGLTLPATVATPGGTLSGAALAALSKAGTAAFFSTQGNAFTPRTASFIIQPHFPPGVKDAAAGPLFGVQFSNLLCSDVNPRLPLGLAGDPGGLPLYKAGRAVGGIGVEGNGVYTVDFDPSDDDVSLEERIAAAGTRGFAAPREIRADRILVGGLRLPFANTDDVAGPPALSFATLAASGTVEVAPRDAPAPGLLPARLAGVRGTADPRFFPARGSVEPSTADGGLTAVEAERVLARGARRAERLRAAIRRPIGDRARVSIAVVDRGGNVLGVFRTADAPVFGFDVSVQKARGTTFASRSDAGERLHAVSYLAAFADAAARDGIAFDGQIAFADRSIGFLSRPFFPDGIGGTRNGPLSRPVERWSVFNDGLQVEIVKPALLKLLGVLPGGPPVNCADAVDMASVAGGIQIFPGAVPLYRGRTLVGGVGVSGDGVDQDDAVALAASGPFGAPSGMRADRVRVRGVRLPFVKLPRRADVR